MNGGYIALHRKILDWEWYDDINVRVLFFHILLKANFENKEWRGKNIKRGQFITSISHLAKETGLTVMQVRTSLDKLKTTHEITHEGTRNFSVITVNNYDTYQGINTRNSRQVTFKQHTGNTRVTTTNNEKNENNEKKDNISVLPANAVSTYLHSFNDLMGREFQITPGRVTKLKMRLKTYTIEQILQALRNMASDKFYKGDNDRGWSADPDFLIRSDEQIDKFLNKKPTYEKQAVRKLASDEMYAPDGSIVKRGGVASE